MCNTQIKDFSLLRTNLINQENYILISYHNNNDDNNYTTSAARINFDYNYDENCIIGIKIYTLCSNGTGGTILMNKIKEILDTMINWKVILN
jgi:hypothetical protein